MTPELPSTFSSAPDLLTGGLMLMLAGLALSLAHRVIPLLGAWIVRRSCASVEVRDERVLGWIGDWIQAVCYGERCRWLSVDVVEDPIERGPAGPDARRVVFTPGRGSHFFRYRKRWFRLDRRKEETAGEGGVVHREFYRLRTLGRDPALLKEIVREAAHRAETRRRGKVAVHVWGRYQGWRELRLQSARDLDSVVLPRGAREHVVRDVALFRESRAWYADMGIPYRRGYLFHGPPGCGKSSFARALAGHFEMSVYVVGLSSAGMSDERLTEVLGATAPDGILLIEDVDAAFRARGPGRNAGGAARRDLGGGAPEHLTFSGLLNAIDGVAAQEGRLTIMTTNHRGALDPALIRPGRVDLEQHFGLATPDQVEALFLRFYPGCEALARRLALRVPPDTLSPAALQGIFLQARGQPMLAVRRLLETVDGAVLRLPVGRGAARRAVQP